MRVPATIACILAVSFGTPDAGAQERSGARDQAPLGTLVDPSTAAERPTRRGAPTARAALFSASGDELGVVELRQTPELGVLLSVEADGLEPGTHAIHIHETGECDGPSFSSAGGHYDPREHAHGVLHADGAHAGDMMNLHVGESGRVVADRHARDVTLHTGAVGTLFDGDGSAIIIHAGADDYESQPSGDAGDRIACGVVTR